MLDFNFDLFTKPEYYEETLLRDRKAMVAYWIDKEKAEFVRDVISLANTARMLGKPAYLILGVRDSADGTVDDICGIGEMFERKIGQGKTEQQAIEAIRHEMIVDIVHQYVSPIPQIEIKLRNLGDKVIGYILIRPLTGEPFRVSREFRRGGKTYLRPGQCWIRFGESKKEIRVEELSPDSDKLRYCYAEVPYVLPSVWERYFEHVQQEIYRCWEEFDVPDEAGYQELHDHRGRPIQEIVDDFLEQSDARLLILQGEAGGGKSLFMQRLAKTLAEQGAQDMKDAQRQEEFSPPSGFIPIFYRLRELTWRARKESAHLTKILCNLLSPLWEGHERPLYPEKLFENSRLNWLILLDGLDEIGEYAKRREFLRTLTEFMASYPRVRIIMTTRPSPGINLESIHHANLVEIAPLDENQITNFLLAYRTDRNEIEEFLAICKAWEDAWQLLRVPAYLNAAALVIGIPRVIADVPESSDNSVAPADVPESEPVKPVDLLDTTDELPNAIEQADLNLEVSEPVTDEIPELLNIQQSDDDFVLTLPRLLDGIYNAFWERENRRGLMEKTNSWRCGTHALAAKSMQDCPVPVRRDRARRHLKEKGLRWVLEMGILSENEHEHVFFTIPSAQIYSAAKQLQGDIESGFWEDISYYRRRWREAYRSKVESFYEEITGKSLSTILEGGSNG